MAETDDVGPVLAETDRECQALGMVAQKFKGTLKADGTMRQAPRRPDGLRDHARRVLQSQNEGWPEANRTRHAGD